MDKAEQRALEHYPSLTSSCDRSKRQAFRNGYHSAEKDLALTWEDVAKIDAIILDVNNEFAVDYSKEVSRQKFYEEVLKRFNEQRKK